MTLSMSAGAHRPPNAVWRQCLRRNAGSEGVEAVPNNLSSPNQEPSVQHEGSVCLHHLAPLLVKGAWPLRTVPLIVFPTCPTTIDSTGVCPTTIDNIHLLGGVCGPDHYRQPHTQGCPTTIDSYPACQQLLTQAMILRNNHYIYNHVPPLRVVVS